MTHYILNYVSLHRCILTIDRHTRHALHRAAVHADDIEVRAYIARYALATAYLIVEGLGVHDRFLEVLDCMTEVVGQDPELENEADGSANHDAKPTSYSDLQEGLIYHPALYGGPAYSRAGPAHRTDEAIEVAVRHAVLEYLLPVLSGWNSTRRYRIAQRRARHSLG